MIKGMIFATAIVGIASAAQVSASTPTSSRFDCDSRYDSCMIATHNSIQCEIAYNNCMATQTDPGRPFFGAIRDR